MPWTSAREIVRRLKGHWHGKSGMVCCPAHDDRSPSLNVTRAHDGRVLVYCHAGCSQQAVIDSLKRLNLWDADDKPTGHASYPFRMTSRDDRITTEEERDRRRMAQEIWQKSHELKGTHGEAYIKARGIKLPPKVFEQLRFVKSLKHNGSGKSLPAIIARIADDNGTCAIQRLYLDPYEAKKANVDPNKMTLGPMQGGAVRLWVPASLDKLGLAEGIETALSVTQLYSMPVWATCGVNRLTHVDIPASVKTLGLFCDQGGEDEKIALDAAETWQARGYRVELYWPRSDFNAVGKMDFNDLVRSGAARAEAVRRYG